MRRITLGILRVGILLLGVWGGHTALAVEGIEPFLNGVTNCDAGVGETFPGATCGDTYELRCLQGSTLLCFDLEDTNSTDCVQAAMIGHSPTSILGKGVERVSCTGGSACLFRQGTGVMRAYVSVWTTSNNSAGIGDAAPRDYRLTAKCFLGTEPRRARILLIENQ